MCQQQLGPSQKKRDEEGSFSTRDQQFIMNCQGAHKRDVTSVTVTKKNPETYANYSTRDVSITVSINAKTISVSKKVTEK